jgi:hypothetical protein
VIGPLGAGTDHAEVQVAEQRPVRPQRQHPLRRVEQQHVPARAVVDEPVVDQRVLGQVQGGHSLPQHVVRHRGLGQRRRCGEPQARVVGAQRHQAHAALLHDLPGTRGGATGRQPGVAGADRGVPGERQLAARCEDPQPVVGGRVGGAEQEGRLGQVRPAGEGGHLLVGEVVGAVHHGDRVAEVGHGGEHVDLGEAVRGGHGATVGPRRTCDGPVPWCSRTAGRGRPRPQSAMKARMSWISASWYAPEMPCGAPG